MYMANTLYMANINLTHTYYSVSIDFWDQKCFFKLKE